MFIKNSLLTIFALSISLFSGLSFAGGFGQTLCKTADYHCVTIAKGQTWATLFADEQTRMVVKKINRMNTPLHKGMVIAVPNNLTNNLMDYAPFPSKIDSKSSELVQVNLSQLAWGAYDEQGNLVNWGPISGGKGYCPDVGRKCGTPTGTYHAYRKQGPGCISHKFPIPRGGAPMPYCMHFSGGYALHGSPTVPGYNASHGCVRLFTEDAKWLNQHFVDIGSTVIRISR